MTDMRKTFAALLLSLVFLSCTDTKQTETTGSTRLVADESLFPIIDDQLIVFENIYKNAKIAAEYKHEKAVINDLLTDSTKIAVIARKLTPAELKVVEKREVKVRVNRFAVDAITLVSNENSGDTVITVQEIIDIMKGAASKRQLVFDNPNSSVVRYLMELAGITALPAKGIYALNSNAEVIKYVHNNLGSIGVIGFNWIKQPTKELEPMVAELNVMGVKGLPGKSGSDKFYKPSQDNLALEKYPLSRNLYIINSQGGGGLGLGFAAFLAGEVGQRVILKSGLLPDSMPPREIIIRK